MKTKKLTSKPPPAPSSAAPEARSATPATPQAVNQAAVATMADAIDAIREQIDAIRSGKEQPSRRDPGSLIASLGAKAGAIYEATRKAEAARIKSLAKLSPALVIAWYRSLDEADREQLRQELDHADSKKSGLA